jgi:hypothetical protein
MLPRRRGCLAPLALLALLGPPVLLGARERRAPLALWVPPVPRDPFPISPCPPV